MYLLLIVLFLAAASWLLSLGIRRKRTAVAVTGAMLLAITLLGLIAMSYWGEFLWFEAAGYPERFWTEILARIGTAFGAGLGGAIVLTLMALPVGGASRKRTAAIIAVGAFVGMVWGWAAWDELLRFWHRVSAGLEDPVFHHDVSFYLFTLPLLDRILWLLFSLFGVAVAGHAIARFADMGPNAKTGGDPVRALATLAREVSPHLAGILLIVISLKIMVATFHLLYSSHGVVIGAGWTDVHIRLPARYLTALLLAVAGLILIIVPRTRTFRDADSPKWRHPTLWVPPALALLAWFLGTAVIPELAQWLYVRPNEVTVEKPYIERNIHFTRLGFRLDRIEEKVFPVSEEFTRQTASENREVLSQVRLWDPRALKAVYEQFQEIRLYYEFADVDIDRYTIDGEYRQVMVSPRELALENLSESSQTFVNRHFKYTHGYGLAMAPVNRFTSGGLPDLLVKNLPPKSNRPELQIVRPEIYYGELTREYAVVNTREKEFDYPSGEHNVYTRYEGRGGVELSSWWRKFIFGWKLGGTKFLLSGYPTAESRVMFARNIRERVRKLAPFLEFDRDPYLILHEGRLVWMIDGYTTSRWFPYSERFASRGLGLATGPLSAPAAHGSGLAGKNYVRNAVKAVIDAFDGSVAFHVFDPEDPVIRVWRKVFPELFQSRNAMAEGLQAHIRYPEDFLLAQGLVYARYHMTDPEVFYNQEDIWVRATEKYYRDVQPVEPYYVLWQPPDSEAVEFILMLPFTPKHRQVLIGWIAGMCDGENYGRLLSYQFPKEKRVLGIQQVETKIDQDAYLSQQLSLWDQRGSRVVRGNVLAIPVADTLVYVEPIYLQAEAAAYPELRMVAVMHDDRLSYAENFDEALRGLYEDGDDSKLPVPGASTDELSPSLDRLIRKANQAFESYLDATGRSDFEAAARQLETLEKHLGQLESASGEEADEKTRPPAQDGGE